MTAFRVLEVLAGTPGFVPRLRAPLVGRGNELIRMVEVFDGVVSERRCRLLEVLGEPGIGKSRLLDEFGAGVSARGTVLRGRCPSYGEATTFLPLVQTIRQAAGIAATDPPERARERLMAALPVAEEGTTIEAAVERLAELLDLPGAEETPKQTSWAVRLLFESVASHLPLVVVLDDAQWAEPSLLDVVRNLVTASTASPILVVVAARPELREQTPPWDEGLEDVAVVELAPLPEAQALDLVAGLLGADPAPGLAPAVVEVADGNPLFIEEVLSRMIDAGAIEHRANGWVRTSGSAPMIPPSLQGLLQARLELLSSEERAVLEAAAVEGYAFGADTAAAVVADALRADPESLLAGLLRRDILRPGRPKIPGERGLRFRHQLMRDATYAAIPKSRRVVLHERLANRLEEGRDRDEVTDVIGHHLERAHAFGLELGLPADRTRALASRATDHLLAAGRRASAAFANEEAIDLYRRAVELLDGADPRSVDALEGEGTILALVGRSEEAEARLSEALDRVAVGDPLTVARLHRERALARRNRHGWDEAEDDLRSAERTIDEVDAQRRDATHWHEWIEIALERMSFLYFAGRREELARFFASATEEIARRGTPVQLTRLYSARVDVDFVTDRCDVTDASVADSREYVRAAREAGDPGILAWACLGDGFFGFLRGDVEGSRDIFTEGLALAERVGDALTACRILAYLPLPLRDAADPGPARDAAERGSEAATACGLKEYEATALGHLAWAALAEGDPEAAGRLGRDAFATWAGVDAPMPLRWIATWPLIAAAVQVGDVGAGLEHAADLLAPGQWPHPSSAVPLVQAAIEVRDGGDLERARVHLEAALDLARAAHVL